MNNNKESNLAQEAVDAAYADIEDKKTIYNQLLGFAQSASENATKLRLISEKASAEARTAEGYRDIQQQAATLAYNELLLANANLLRIVGRAITGEETTVAACIEKEAILPLTHSDKHQDESLLAAELYKVERIYLTRSRHLGVMIDNKIHWFADKLVSLDEAVSILSHLNVDFNKHDNTWTYHKECGDSLNVTELLADDANLAHDYMREAKRTPVGNLWWTLKEIKDTYFNY